MKEGSPQKSEVSGETREARDLQVIVVLCLRCIVAAELSKAREEGGR